MHAEHPEPALARGRVGAEAHQGRGDREAVGGGELAQLLGGVGVDHAAAAVEDRPARVGQRLGGDPDLFDVALGRGLVAGQLDRLGARRVVDVGAREVLRDVEQDRPGAPGRGDVEGLVHVLGDLARVGDLEGVLHERQRGAEDVGLLEAVGADQLGADLAGDEDGRDRVQHRVGDRRDQVGRAGAGGGEGDPDPAGGLGVALGRVAAALLVAHLDVAEVGVDHRVVGRQVRPTGDPEDVLDALGLEAIPSACPRLSSDWRCYQRAAHGLRRARLRLASGDFAGFQRVRGSIEASIALPL